METECQTTATKASVAGERLERYEARSRVPMIVLSLAFVATLGLEQFITRGTLWVVIAGIDIVLWGVFATDYFYRLKLARRRWSYALQPLNLVDAFVVATPIFALLGAGFFGLARVARLMRLFGLLRAGGLAARSAQRIVCEVTRPSNARLAVGFAVAVALGAAIGVWAVEHDHTGSGPKSWFDTAWWSLSTVTTVGYGDISPDTALGKALAMVLMLAGIAVFGWLMAVLTSRFVQSDESDMNRRLLERLEEVSHRLEALEAALRHAGDGT